MKELRNSETTAEKPLKQLDYRLLELLRHHDEGLTMREIFSLLETSEYLAIRYRLRRLGAAGLLKWSWREGEKRFSITPKGIRLLEEAAYGLD
ncbi:MAG: winged helix DNA-binding protein [Halobacteriota archaeon]